MLPSRVVMSAKPLSPLAAARLQFARQQAAASGGRAATPKPAAGANAVVRRPELASHPRSAEVRSLYRSLVRYARTIELSDKNWYLNSVRKEVRKYQGETKPSIIDALIQRGNAFLSSRKIL
ncbi:hypothetical protein H696_04725 [Fonticula alba]|uniref:Complex 1 LYR protein domain-containing protein n=1 Tax=Fonticula alba TaxID=691883 RepID=A0A058Z2T4_FONAL|nr:hypothetical protein H696_04725 [Fonticula alba]KCV68431.1 hypothetical protein H696_04725 [Fonticula alba]|eukprot:XP_009496863.1 hypothetical protein H696_04725 [Fonticula alba]